MEFTQGTVTYEYAVLVTSKCKKKGLFDIPLLETQAPLLEGLSFKRGLWYSKTLGTLRPAYAWE